MKNNNGTSFEEVFVTVIPTFFMAFLTANLVFVAQPIGIVTAFVIEFSFVVVSTILHVTVLQHRIWEIMLIVSGLVVTAFVKQCSGRIHLAPFVQMPCQRPEYLSSLRAGINLITCVCILAVDFKCFPRKLAKTETFGFSVMDTGVGLYVFGNGLVAPELRKSMESNRLTWKKVEKTFRSCLPLVILGAVRFIATNELDYQQHVSEYGVHWNFFLTLACTKFFGTILLGILPHFEYIKYLAAILLLLHELILQLGGAEYITNPKNTIKRDNFLNANREGIVSIMGYISLYLFSVYIGYWLRKMDAAPESNKKTQNFINVRPLFWKSVRLFIVALILWKLTYIMKNMFGVSRRIANMGYVLWILSIGTAATSLCMGGEIFYYFISFNQPSPEQNDEDDNSEKINYLPIILSGITYNGLLFFLLANLLTGVVNLCFQTLLLTTVQSLAIICTYMLTLCTITTFLYVKKIKLKVW